MVSTPLATASRHTAKATRAAVAVTAVTAAVVATAVVLSPVASAATPAAPTTNSSTSKIRGSAGVLSFVPSSVTGKVVTGTCSSTNYSFRVINTTPHTQSLIYQGQVFTKIRPNFESPICSAGALSGTLSIKAYPKAVLSFTIS